MNLQENKTIGLLSLTLCAMLILLPSCGSTPTAATSPEENSVEQLHAKGARLYRRKCLDCHGLYAPSRYTDASWVSIMQGMAVEANLNDEDHQLILDFLLASN